MRHRQRHVVLDNEAVRALLASAPADHARAEIIEALAAANGSRLVPTAVRGEAGWRRRDDLAAKANRLVPHDHMLDRDGADRVVELRRAVPSASVADASVAVAAEALASEDAVVEVLTSDVPDLSALAEHVVGTVIVTRV